MTRTEPTPAPVAEGSDARARRDEIRRERDSRAEQWEERLAVPVIIAAVVSVPAVFLTMAESGFVAVAGHVLNGASLAVLGAEAVVLLVMCGNTWAWVKRHKWSLAITVVAVPAVVFALAPAQALRLIRLARLIGTLRILRAKTIVKAGQVLARRFGLTGWLRYVLVLAGSLVAAVFVAVVLFDPTSARQHRRVLEELTGWSGVVPVIVAGVILAAATYVVVRYRHRQPEPDAGSDDPPAG